MFSIIFEFKCQGLILADFYFLISAFALSKVKQLLNKQDGRDWSFYLLYCSPTSHLHHWALSKKRFKNVLTFFLSSLQLSPIIYSTLMAKPDNLMYVWYKESWSHIYPSEGGNNNGFSGPCFLVSKWYVQICGRRTIIFWNIFCWDAGGGVLVIPHRPGPAVLPAVLLPRPLPVLPGARPSLHHPGHLSRLQVSTEQNSPASSWFLPQLWRRLFLWLELSEVLGAGVLLQLWLHQLSGLRQELRQVWRRL